MKDAEKFKQINTQLLNTQQMSDQGLSTQQGTSDASAEITIQPAQATKEETKAVVFKIEVKDDFVAANDAENPDSSSTDSPISEISEDSQSKSPQSTIDNDGNWSAFSPSKKSVKGLESEGHMKWTAYVSTAIVSSAALACVVVAAALRPKHWT